jgi:hypothetical protein
VPAIDTAIITWLASFAAPVGPRPQQVEHRRRPLERVGRTRGHHREARVLGAADAAADRHVEHRRPAGGRRHRQPLHRLRIHRAHHDHVERPASGRHQPVRAQQQLLCLGAGPQHRHDPVGLRDHRRGVGGGLDPVLRGRGQALVVAVEGDDPPAGPNEVGRHRAAHLAEPDPADDRGAHARPPLVGRTRVGRGARSGGSSVMDAMLGRSTSDVNP